MIADWTVEAGPASPSIDIPWENWVDLRTHPELVDGLPEVRAYPELAPVLRLLEESGLRTSKVDVFPVAREEVDPELAEAGLAETACGLGSYVDCLLPSGFAACERAARALSARLAARALPLALAEIVVRPARLYDEKAFGWTLYAIGFGASEARARAVWAEVARAVAEDFAAVRNAGE